WLLLLAPAEAEGRGAFSLRVALPSFYREACASLAGSPFAGKLPRPAPAEL
ncbi:MAG: hypothetical protein JRS35_14840, partial [Deltaproteobacteria bacterium]|nr:hypothetical protein [Deltaproteobacteria bacterium]